MKKNSKTGECKDRLLTHEQWVSELKKQGFSLYKTKPTQKKLKLLFKIQKMTSTENIG